MLAFRESGLKKTFDYLKNFGFENELEVVMPGTNAKMNEMQALMGSMMLKYLDTLIEKRRRITQVYRECLQDVPGVKLPSQVPDDVDYNYAYVPVEIFEEEFGMSRDELYASLKEYNIYARRYFHPLVCDYPCYRNVVVGKAMPVARAVASRILTLPIYPDLALDDVHRICEIVMHLAGGKVKGARQKAPILSTAASHPAMKEPATRAVSGSETLVTP